MIVTPWSLFLQWLREYIAYLEVYLVYFFIRASILLFVLRLLPSYKKWQQNLVYGVFSVNFIVTAYTCITFGVSCRPFRANWMTVPNSKCFSVDVIVITNQVNASKSLMTTVTMPTFPRALTHSKGLACVCDIATAIIPMVLLWNVKMRTSTKRILNILFGLSLVTAALSIGRAATITKKTLTEDTTCWFALSHAFETSWWLKREHDPVILLQYVWGKTWYHLRMWSGSASVLGISQKDEVVLAHEAPTVSKWRFRENATSD